RGAVPHPGSQRRSGGQKRASAGGCGVRLCLHGGRMPLCFSARVCVRSLPPGHAAGRLAGRPPPTREAPLLPPPFLRDRILVTPAFPDFPKNTLIYPNAGRPVLAAAFDLLRISRFGRAYQYCLFPLFEFPDPMNKIPCSAE